MSDTEDNDEYDALMYNKELLSMILAKIEEVRGLDIKIAQRTDLTDSLREIARDTSAKYILNLETEAVRLEARIERLETGETEETEEMKETDILLNFDQRQLFQNILRVLGGCRDANAELEFAINSIEFVTFILKHYKFYKDFLEHLLSLTANPQIRDAIKAVIPIRTGLGLVCYGAQDVYLTR